ncbi:flagellar protein FlgN [Virgibacillus kimchii]
MSIEEIIGSVDELIQYHERLLAISEQKTAVIIDGNIEELQKLLVKERKEARLLEQAEEKRQAGVQEWFLRRRDSREATLTNMLEVIKNPMERDQLGRTTIQLTELITKLKQQEELNQALLNQSMKFVQLTMGMVNPDLKEMNYGKQKQTGPTVQHSVFDSQA